MIKPNTFVFNLKRENIKLFSYEVSMTNFFASFPISDGNNTDKVVLMRSCAGKSKAHKQEMQFS